MVGFWVAALYDDGPVQLYVAPATVGADRFSVAPAHSGPLLDAVITGSAGSDKVTGPAAAEVQPFRVTVILV